VHRPRFGYGQQSIHVSQVVARWWRGGGEVASVTNRQRFGHGQQSIHVSQVVARWWRFSWAGPRRQIGLRRPGKSNVYINVFLLSQVDSNKQCFHNPVYAYLSAARNSSHSQDVAGQAKRQVGNTSSIFRPTPRLWDQTFRWRGYRRRPRNSSFLRDIAILQRLLSSRSCPGPGLLSLVPRCPYN
jgi:hypothetical protein